jgi:hypothetical protein
VGGQATALKEAAGRTRRRPRREQQEQQENDGDSGDDQDDPRSSVLGGER